MFYHQLTMHYFTSFYCLYFYRNFISTTPLLLMVQTQAHPHSKTILGEPGSPKRDVLYRKEGRISIGGRRICRLRLPPGGRNGELAEISKRLDKAVIMSIVRRKSHFKWNCCTDFFCQLILVHNGPIQHFPEGVQHFVQWHFLKSNMAAATSLNH